MKKKLKKLYMGIVVILIALIIGTVLIINNNTLPRPQVSEGERGKLGIDANINEATIDKYLNRSDAVYYDMRMLMEEADWEKIGGVSNITGFVEGFEVLPLPYLTTGIIDASLAEIVGQGYSGHTLFTHQEDGTYVANYQESMSILEYFFPKDKYIFLMCGGGGYAGTMKNMLVSLGYNKDKIYDVGGYWYYKGQNNVQVLNDKGLYDWWKVTYHSINFDDLTEVK